MRERIERALFEGRRRGGKLPSVRELARRFGASPQTVHKAIANLAARGVLHVLPRKGAFWGATPDPEPGNLLKIPHWMQVRERLLDDIRKGAFHPHREMPSRKEMAGLYGIPRKRLSALVDEFVSSGILRRSGRGLTLPPPLARPSQSVVLAVVRCDARGRIILETEREADFLKSLRREALEQDARVNVVGYHESEGSGTFLDPRGGACRPQDLPGVVVGCVASTWLLRDPLAMIRSLQPIKVPIAVWWEHPRDRFPARWPRESPLAGYDLSFGKSPGIEVGRRLLAEGFREVAFVSPYHGNDWSRSRLEGLREAMGTEGGVVTDFVSEAFHSPWHLRSGSEGDPEGDMVLGRILGGFLEDPALSASPAWVVVNDEATAMLLDLAAERGIRIPRLVSFDGGSLSETRRFDSFEFHNDGMVRRMFRHIFHRRPLPTNVPALEEMVGRLVLRG